MSTCVEFKRRLSHLIIAKAPIKLFIQSFKHKMSICMTLNEELQLNQYEI